ncbi:MAG: bifunctional diaminohydroxyphosphoribosylaminopyrimidine deaminase/5-amino-6-(5-phosphoribosylamino)uracil reductase RibD [Acidimicrobiales bacterium]|jgi:diaminohydroxyphosphoribosylaminopyrimidine deaminase/5-amino-6-(5-phosphoribosylamino)uracil reductase
MTDSVGEHSTASPADQVMMRRAVANADRVRGSTAPNPWVGAVLVSADGAHVCDGATQPVGGAHAERQALTAADQQQIPTSGATMYTTLEPCDHTGRTGPCTQALIDAGVARVVVGIIDADPLVGGRGIERLRNAGIETTVGIEADLVTTQLAPYLHHRVTGRPWVVLKLAITLDGRTAAPDGSSQWITGHEARVDAHRLRARCDAILVGAGTVRADNPSLTVRHVDGVDPRRVVLGNVAADANVHPCWEMTGAVTDVLQELGERGVVDLMVEGGASVAADFHRSGLVNEYVIYMAPALFGGADGRPLFSGTGGASMNDLWRGALGSVERVGADLRLEMFARTP